MIEKIDAFGRDKTPGYDDLIKARLPTQCQRLCWGDV